jgi:hypothetical protein
MTRARPEGVGTVVSDHRERRRVQQHFTRFLERDPPKLATASSSLPLCPDPTIVCAARRGARGAVRSAAPLAGADLSLEMRAPRGVVVSKRLVTG